MWDAATAALRARTAARQNLGTANSANLLYTFHFSSLVSIRMVSTGQMIGVYVIKGCHNAACLNSLP